MKPLLKRTINAHELEMFALAIYTKMYFSVDNLLPSSPYCNALIKMNKVSQYFHDIKKMIFSFNICVSFRAHE